jgi:hypothetical protein
LTPEQVFTLEATPLKYGPGAAAEAGWELERLGVKRAMLVSDPGVAAAGITARTSSRPTPRSQRPPRSRPTAALTASSGSAAGRASTPPRCRT